MNIRFVMANIGLVWILSVSSSALAQNLIKNGGFEKPPISQIEHVIGENKIDNWMGILNGVERFDPADYDAGDAREKACVDLNTDSVRGGGIQQTINTEPNETYVLAFDIATWKGFGREGVGRIRVMAVGNSPAKDFEVQNTESQVNWVSQTYEFTATAPRSVIIFSNFDPKDTSFSLLDDVSVKKKSRSSPTKPETSNK